jgi:hypothetical protein
VPSIRRGMECANRRISVNPGTPHSIPSALIGTPRALLLCDSTPCRPARAVHVERETFSLLVLKSQSSVAFNGRRPGKTAANERADHVGIGVAKLRIGILKFRFSRNLL